MFQNCLLEKPHLGLSNIFVRYFILFWPHCVSCGIDREAPLKRVCYSQAPGGGVKLHRVGPHGEAPGSVRRQREREELWARAFTLSTVRARPGEQAEERLVWIVSGGCGHRAVPGCRVPGLGGGWGRGRMGESVSPQ